MLAWLAQNRWSFNIIIFYFLNIVFVFGTFGPSSRIEQSLDWFLRVLFTVHLKTALALL